AGAQWPARGHWRARSALLAGRPHGAGFRRSGHHRGGRQISTLTVLRETPATRQPPQGRGAVKPLGTAPAADHAASNQASFSSQARSMGRPSSPQKSLPSTPNAGTPNTPWAAASSVLLRNVAFT